MAGVRFVSGRRLDERRRHEVELTESLRRIRGRAELGLPLRERYFADLIRVTDDIGTLRLPFRYRRPCGGWQVRYLMFLIRKNRSAASRRASGMRSVDRRLTFDRA